MNKLPEKSTFNVWSLVSLLFGLSALVWVYFSFATDSKKAAVDAEHRRVKVMEEMQELKSSISQDLKSTETSIGETENILSQQIDGYMELTEEDIKAFGRDTASESK